MKDILLKVRELLAEPENWMQGSFGSYQGKCFCLVGAINVVQGLSPAAMTSASNPVIKAVAKAISPRSQNYQYDGAILTWNDAEGRTHAEVLALLDKALETAS